MRLRLYVSSGMHCVASSATEAIPWLCLGYRASVAAVRDSLEPTSVAMKSAVGCARVDHMIV